MAKSIIERIRAEKEARNATREAHAESSAPEPSTGRGGQAPEIFSHGVHLIPEPSAPREKKSFGAAPFFNRSRCAGFQRMDVGKKCSQGMVQRFRGQWAQDLKLALIPITLARVFSSRVASRKAVEATFC